MRPRYVHRVTPGDIGSRVSIRRWVTDPERGPIPSDVVGRLLAWADDDVLRVVTRDGTRHEIEASSILASRTVPEHPSLPPEPYA